MEPETETEMLSYFGGFFDGEGCVQIFKKPHQGIRKTQTIWILDVCVANCNPFPLKMLKEHFGGTIEKDSTSPRPCFKWRVTSMLARDFLTAIQPYVLVKYSEVKVALDFSKHLTYQGKIVPPQEVCFREACRETLKNLKRVFYYDID